MDEERLFTLEEAQELLDRRVRGLAQEMVDLSARTRPMERRWQALVVKIGSNGGGLDKREAERLRETLESAQREIAELIGEITALGVQVKDIDRGLLDFPSTVDGQDALLCWHVGEERIAHWHSPEDGFAGRRPL